MDFIKKENIKFRSISNIIGCLMMFAAGLFFVLIVDLKVNKFEDIVIKDANGVEIKTITFLLSSYLLFAIIFAAGAGIFYFLGDSCKNKHIQTLIFKGIGILLAIAFIFFLFIFKDKIELYRYPSNYYPDYFAATKSFTTEKIYNTAMRTVTISLILDIIGLVALVFNYVLSILFIDEDY